MSSMNGLLAVKLKDIKNITLFNNAFIKTLSDKLSMKDAMLLHTYMNCLDVKLYRKYLCTLVHISQLFIMNTYFYLCLQKSDLRDGLRHFFWPNLIYGLII